MVNVKLGIVVRESPCFEEYAIDSAVSFECFGFNSISD